MSFNLEEYELVEDRLKAYWKDNPQGRISTEVVHITDDGTCVTIKAEIFVWHEDVGLYCVATGIAQETQGQGGFANKDAWVENCETSAIGRALANWKYQGSNKRPSRQEMSKVGGSNATKKNTTEPRQFDTKWEKKKQEIIDTKVNVDKSEVSLESPSQKSGLSSVEDIAKDAGVTLTEIPTWENGCKKYDENGVPTCPCESNKPIMIIRPEEKKSEKSPDIRCSAAGFCTGGDTVNGKTFAKSWWLDNAKTPKEYQTHYHKVMQKETELLGRPMEDIGEDEAPF